jgi:hypothetical protein
LSVRLESSAQETFLPTFNIEGQGAWSAWDEFLARRFTGLKFKQCWLCTDSTYCFSHLGVEKSPVDAKEHETHPSKSSEMSVPFSLLLDEDGWPLLPQIDQYSLSELKCLIRLYLTLCYS